MADGWVQRLGDPRDRRAPRLRMAVLVLVGLVVAVMLVVVLVTRDQSVTGITTGYGVLCVGIDQRSWTSADTVVPFDPESTAYPPTVSISGTWHDTGERTAQLTTPTGQVIEMRTSQPENPDFKEQNISCAIR